MKRKNSRTVALKEDHPNKKEGQLNKKEHFQYSQLTSPNNDEIDPCDPGLLSFLIQGVLLI